MEPTQNSGLPNWTRFLAMQAYPPGFIKSVRDRISVVIAAYSANDVPAICRRYGLATGDRDEAMGSKARYVSTRRHWGPADN